MDVQPSLLLALACGFAIAAACGLRAFLPLLGVGLAARFLHVPLAPAAEWLRSDLVLIALGAATVFEIAGDKIPVVDHALDVAGTLLRPAAGALASYALLDRLPSPWNGIAALVFGAGALFVHAAKAKARIGSTALTMGAANPVLSFVEDGLTLGIVLAALLAPLIALIGVLVLFAFLVRWIRRRGERRALRATSGA